MSESFLQFLLLAQHSYGSWAIGQISRPSTVGFNGRFFKRSFLFLLTYPAHCVHWRWSFSKSVCRAGRGCLFFFSVCVERGAQSSTHLPVKAGTGSGRGQNTSETRPSKANSLIFSVLHWCYRHFVWSIPPFRPCFLHHINHRALLMVYLFHPV